MKFGNHILRYQDDILKTLGQLIPIPSVCSAPEPGFPFGRNSAAALASILQTAESMGLSVKNVGNYAGHAAYGTGDTCADVMNHVDVVPAGQNWSVEPFALTRRGDICYGRGVSDNKGAAVVTLYCLKALKDADVTGKRRLRAVFGAGEEIASNDLDMYYASEGYPAMGFTSDARYGICNREKGILHLDLTGNMPSACVRGFRAGTVVNAVPAVAEADVACDAAQYESLAELAKAPDFRTEKSDGSVHITAFGKAAHAADPSLGVNAAIRLIARLAEVYPVQDLGGLLTFLHEKIGTAFDGAALGVAQADRQSGPLTLNLGIVTVENGTALARLDIRYPVTGDGDAIVAKIRQAAAPYHVTVHTDKMEKPLYVPENLPLIGLLQNAYRDVTGKPCNIYAMGGGTYARKAHGAAVAFGPLFPEDPDTNAHTADEHISFPRLMRHAQVCLEAMYRMMTE